MALSSRMAALRCVRSAAVSSGVDDVCWTKNSPGNRRVVPYTSSATLNCKSVLREVRIPRRTVGSN